MKLPVDIPTLLSAAVDIDRARTIPVSVNILIDETASPEFQAFVRSGFNSLSPNSRIMVSYYPTQMPDSFLACDLTVIVAGANEVTGAIASVFRESDSLVLVVAEDGNEVCERARQAGDPIPEEEIIALDDQSVLDDETRQELADRVGYRIVKEIDPEKKLAFSIAFPFVRRPLAYDAINATAIQNAGVGVVVFVPGADMPVMTANQIKMVLQIAAAYGQDLSTERIKELVCVLANAFMCRGIARQLAGMVPALGWAVKGSVGFIGTQAIGRAAIEYFEGGGSIAGLSALVGKTTDNVARVVDFVQSDPTLCSVRQKVLPVVQKAAIITLDIVGPAAQSATKAVFSSLRSGLKTKRSSRSQS